MSSRFSTPLAIIFTTVLVDLLGFGIVIPLVALYGVRFGASGAELAFLGAAYSLAQFFFAPLWGTLSDRYGRRPIILLSLLGSTISYFLFAFAPSFWWLILSRAFAGVFAGNISAAQAYIADVTTPEKRAQGMALIGVAFGLGFTLGPPLGGWAQYAYGLSAPGIIAGTICGTNLLVAIFRLPESLAPELRARASSRSLSPLNPDGVRILISRSILLGLVATFFFTTFAFSHFEQTFALLFQTKFGFSTEESGLRSGLVLFWVGIVGIFVQGFFVRRLLQSKPEETVLRAGLVLNGLAILLFPFGPSYESYFLFAIPLAFGSGLINPSLTGLISRNAGPDEQGAVLGLNQGLGSLARAIGPASGLFLFSMDYHLPFLLGGSIFLVILLIRSIRMRHGIS